MQPHPHKWPNDAKTAVMVTVNLDAETFANVFVENADTIEGTAVEIMGRNGMETCLPRILDTLARYGVKGTFFVPGMVALKYPEAIKEIATLGHEIGCRGWQNENLALLSSEQQHEVILRGRQAVTEVCATVPVGFRAPAGELTTETLEIAHELGFTYSSSLSDEDVPYVIDLPGGGSILEIPYQWSLYDLPYFAFYFDPPIPAGQSRISLSDDVLTNWMWEYDGAYNYGTCYVLQLDPHVTGSQGKIYILERLLEYVIGKGSAWFATGSDILKHHMQG